MAEAVRTTKATGRGYNTWYNRITIPHIYSAYISMVRRFKPTMPVDYLVLDASDTYLGISQRVKDQQISLLGTAHMVRMMPVGMTQGRGWFVFGYTRFLWLFQQPKSVR